MKPGDLIIDRGDGELGLVISSHQLRRTSSENLPHKTHRILWMNAQTTMVDDSAFTGGWVIIISHAAVD